MAHKKKPPLDEKFIAAARELECDESEGAFIEKLKESPLSNR